jgi:VCBS repeat-containing protein
VREAAFATKDLDGALGRWSVDANGDTTYAAEQLYVVRGLPGGATAWLWDSEITP